MRAAEIIERATEQGVQLALSSSGKISAKGTPSAIDRWLPVIRQSKAALVAELQIDLRRSRVLAMLRDHPCSRYAVEVVDESTEQVIVAIGIQKVATFEIEIPLAYYDGISLLRIIEEHTVE